MANPLFLRQPWCNSSGGTSQHIALPSMGRCGWCLPQICDPKSSASGCGVGHSMEAMFAADCGGGGHKTGAVVKRLETFGVCLRSFAWDRARDFERF